MRTIAPHPRNNAPACHQTIKAEQTSRTDTMPSTEPNPPHKCSNLQP